MKKIVLVKPDEAEGEVAEIFADIKATKGDRYLTPTWGFFANDPTLLKHWWGLTKRLQMTEGAISTRLRNCISLVCAKGVNCPRCINNHQTHLMEHFNMDADDVEDVLDYENGDLPANEKAVLRLADKLAFGKEVTDEEYNELREFGYDETAIVEIASMAFLESSMAKHAVIIAKYEDGENWPKENVPTPFYHENVDR